MGVRCERSAAMSYGGRCGGGNCESSTVTPAVVYFPQGGVVDCIRRMLLLSAMFVVSTRCLHLSCKSRQCTLRCPLTLLSIEPTTTRKSSVMPEHPLRSSPRPISAEWPSLVRPP